MSFLNLPEILRVERARRNITQEQMANVIGVSISTYKAIETDKKEPSIHLLRRIASLLKIEIVIS